MALVPGFIPAHAILFEYDLVGFLLIVQVAQHHLVAGNADHAVLAQRQLLPGVRIDDLEAGARQRQADAALPLAHLDPPGPGIHRVGNIDAGHRGRFGSAKALENVLVEFELEFLANMGRQLFCAGYNNSQGFQQDRIDLPVAGIQAQEGGCAEQDSGAVFGHCPGDTQYISGVGVADDRDTLDQRHDHGHRQSEGVERR